MKHFLTFSALLLAFVLPAQAQTIEPAPADKAVVYFARPSSVGFAINFSYFDSTQLIGRFNGPKYIRYECEPGRHLFWARSENRDFVEADLEAGKVYFIEASVRMGAMKAAVALLPVDPNDPKAMKGILRLLGKQQSQSFTPQQLASSEKDLDDAVRRGMEKYKEEKAKGKKIAQLTRDMYYKF
jgi:hypothetical protein